MSQHPKKSEAWKSPISAQHLTKGGADFYELRCENDELYWVEPRPAEKGRCVLVRQDASGKREDLIPPPFSARTRVHEYGGGAFGVQDGLVIFMNFSDHGLYRVRVGQPPKLLHQEQGTWFSDFCLHGEFAYAVREQTISGQGKSEHDCPKFICHRPRSRLWSAGTIFYRSPRISPDGKRLAIVAWDHPNMPWDDTQLLVVELQPSASATRVNQGIAESIDQLHWTEEGELYFVSDRDGGWWNLHRLRGKEVQNLYPVEGEVIPPGWQFANRNWVHEDSQTVLLTVNQGGAWSLRRLHLTTGQITSVETAGVEFHSLCQHEQGTAFVQQFADRG